MTDVAGRPEVFHALLVLGAVLVAVVAVVLRRLRRRAELDEAEELLRTELARYDDPADPIRSRES